MTEKEFSQKLGAIIDSDWKTLRERGEKIDALIRQAHAEIAVGDGVTLHLHSDAQAYTVIARTKCTLTVQRDKVTRSKDFKPEWVEGGFSAVCTNQDDQKWTYERNPAGAVEKLYLGRKTGRFTYLGKTISIGRYEYYDYNF